MLLDIVGRANDYSFVDTCKEFAYSISGEDALVAVVIPHFNAHELLAGCIQSLAHQTFNPEKIEIIVADDGSDTLPTLSEFEQVFRRVTVVSQADRGFRISAVRNLGVRAATSPYIIILDCDMRAVPNFVEEHLKALCVSDQVISVGFRKDNASVDEDWRLPIALSELDWRYGKFLAGGDHWAKFANDQFRLVSGGNIAAHRDQLLNIPFDETFVEWGGEDNEWGYRCIKAGLYIYPNLDARSRHVRPTTAHKLSDLEKAHVRDLTERKCPALSAKSILRGDFEVPYVSVWVTSYNKAAYIEDAIRSTEGIRFSHEIVVIDDGSSDSSLQVLYALQPEFPNLRVIESEHKGAFHAYEKALSECRGDLLLQLDADDVLVADGVNQIIEHMYRQSDGLSFGNFLRVGENLEDIGETVRCPKHPSRHQKLLEGMRILCPRVLRRRDLSRMPPRNPRDAAIDYGLYSKVHLVATSSQIDTLAYLYRQHPQSISHISKSSQFREPNYVMSENIELLEGDFTYSEEQIHDRLRRYQFTSGHALYFRHLGVIDERVQNCLERNLKETQLP